MEGTAATSGRASRPRGLFAKLARLLAHGAGGWHEVRRRGRQGPAGGGEGAENTAAGVAEGGGQGAFFCSLAGVVFGEPITTMGLVGASRQAWMVCAMFVLVCCPPRGCSEGGAGGMCVGQGGSHPTVVFSCLVCFFVVHVCTCAFTVHFMVGFPSLFSFHLKNLVAIKLIWLVEGVNISGLGCVC